MAVNKETYKRMLREYLESPNEIHVLKVKQVGRQFVDNDILPEEMIRIHIESMENFPEELSDNYKLSMNFLLEAMISYRLAYNEIEELRNERFKLKSEIRVAATMQETFLATTVPEIEGLD